MAKSGQSIPSGTSWSGAGKASSMALRSLLESFHPIDSLFSRTCSFRLALGMVNTPECRVRKLRTTCRAVRPCFSAMSAKTWPPLLVEEGKLE